MVSRIDITKYHKFGGLKQQKLFIHFVVVFQETKSSQSRSVELILGGTRGQMSNNGPTPVLSKHLDIHVLVGGSSFKSHLVFVSET